MEKGDLLEAKSQLLTTTTGELLQPVRLHYDLINKKEMLRILNRLGCIDFDPSRQRWPWIYGRESKSLKFKYSYQDLPKEARRVVLGSFFITSNTKMHLDVRSIERVIAAFEFFGPRIPRNVAKLKYLSILNRLLSDPKELPEDFDILFDREEARNFDPEAAQAEAIKDVLMGVKLSTPKVECIPMHDYDYEDGLNHLRLVLFSRQTIAFKYFQGDIDYSMKDFVHELTRGKPIT